MERKGKQTHEHSQEKHKNTQDFRYLNLPQQTVCPSSTATLFDQKKNYTEPFLLFTKISLH